MENENLQSNQKVDSNIKTEQNPITGKDSYPTQESVIAGGGEKATKPVANKRTLKIIVGIIAIIVAFILGSVVTILVQNITGQNNNLDLPWENNNDEREYILSSEIVLPEGFTKLDTTDQIVGEGGYVFKDYEDFEEKVQDPHDQIKVTSYDFGQHKYGLVTLVNRYCRGGGAMPVEMSTEENVVTVRAISWSGCGACSAVYQNYLVELDSEIEDPVIVINEDTISGEGCGSNSSTGILKPMIYLYPEEETAASVQLGKPEKLTATYPKYDNGWKVTAEPSGTLYDMAGREYYGLYWEGTSGDTTIHEDGFVVSREDAAGFLEEKLALLGLTEREANEFIVYWLPKLEANRYNYIRFETQEEINEYMPLEVTPAPDTVIRILMSYKPLDTPIEIKEQKLTSPVRTGFILVEWGGTEIDEEIVE